jgi:hypothetical protein
MKLNGKKLEGPSVETVVLPREDGDLVFRCQAVLDYAEFDLLVKEPIPPTVTKRGETVAVADLTDRDYKKATEQYMLRRFNWMILKSLEATPNLVWETVKVNDPETWLKMDDELKAAGLAQAEIARLYVGATTANGLNEERIKEARARFFSTVRPKEA